VGEPILYSAADAQIGDYIVRPADETMQALGVRYHAGVVVGLVFGHPVDRVHPTDANVIHVDRHGCRVDSLDEFARGRPVVLVSRIDQADAPLVLARAQEQLAAATPWSPMWTCEHLASYVQTGKAESRQLRQVLKFWLVGLFEGQIPRRKPTIPRIRRK
jgi:hypothetical protein